MSEPEGGGGIEGQYLDYEIAKGLAGQGRPHSRDAVRRTLWTGIILVAVMFLLLAGIGWLMR